MVSRVNIDLQSGVVKFHFFSFFFQIIWLIEKFVVPLHHETKNNNNQIKQSNYGKNNF